jgi:GNAT superfamily N-acetyltransferase
VTVRIACAVGGEIAAHTGALAALRIRVFREYPYLYDGSLEYERRYLAGYAGSPDALVVLALAGDDVVGASTALPALAHGEEIAPALARGGLDPARVFYFGESVLEPAHRGKGLGEAFFAERERHARARGYRVAAFCAVERPPDHPMCPAGYLAPGGLWRRRGFVRRPDLVGEMSWRDLGEREETAKPMVFWIKELD